LLEALESERAGARALRRELHERPEPAFAEHQTAKLIRAALPGEPRSVAGTGMILDLGPTPRIAVRAELDALRVAVAGEDGDDATDVRHVHACGHDVHAAALTALCRAVAATAQRLPFGLTAVFQPAEEVYPSGAQALLAEDPLPGVAATVGVHVHPEIPWGSLGLDPGGVNASSDAFRIVVSGTGGHAAYPHHTSDPVLALCDTVVALQGAVARRLDPVKPSLVSVGALSAGSSMNVIPERAEAVGTLRALDAESRIRLREVVAEVVEAVPRAYGCAGEVVFDHGEPILHNDARLVERARGLSVVGGLGLAAPWRSCGGDDFALYGSDRPIGMAFVGLRGAERFRELPLHHPDFSPPDEAVAVAARTQALMFWAAGDVYGRRL
jgi:amidohydrolase